MKRQIKIPPEVAGEEWAGIYTVKTLYVPDSLQIYGELDELIERFEVDTSNQRKVQLLLNWVLVKHAVEKDGKPLPDSIPNKLFEALLPSVTELNALTVEESQSIFLGSSMASQQGSVGK